MRLCEVGVALCEEKQRGVRLNGPGYGDMSIAAGKVDRSTNKSNWSGRGRDQPNVTRGVGRPHRAGARGNDKARPSPYHIDIPGAAPSKKADKILYSIA